ncbi:hypothetical protein TNIN_23211 [Trichonephila inaurata madagascariensis]|uniref:Uncharacterized protein n=1 Tax=Trichonephila inaurata madagascariensis TaxID=2747483 RepID=A0A8X6YDV4_9ARAC|nr:hypothetical protein TNIN_23211 [Trichonephila inaurata madagascariensis]
MCMNVSDLFVRLYCANGDRLMESPILPRWMQATSLERIVGSSDFTPISAQSLIAKRGREISPPFARNYKGKQNKAYRETIPANCSWNNVNSALGILTE